MAKDTVVAKTWLRLPTQWRFLILACLILGIFFRFVNLDSKVYQYDETFTSLRISGYTEVEAVRSLTNAETVSVEALARYQQPSPDKSVLNTVGGLAKEEAQLTPLYFVFARFWAEWFGSSIATIRSLSAVASLLALPCMWWLCLELFESPIASWVGTVILAISPFQVLYAQEARPNGLWATMILLSSAALLRAMRVKTPTSWMVYALSMAMSFYTFLFSGLVAIAHTVYVLGRERRVSRKVFSFVAALSLATIAFLPWLATIVLNLSQIDTVTSWTTEEIRMSLVDLLRIWLHYLLLPFVDYNDLSFPKPIDTLISLTYWAIRLLVLYAFYILCRKTPTRMWLFVVTLTVVPALALIIPDLIWGGARTAVARYMIPSYLGFQLAVTYLLSMKLVTSLAMRHWQQQWWRGVTIALISVGILSSGAIAQNRVWWNKMISNNNPTVAQMINQSDRPLVISDADLGDILSLSHYLDPQVTLMVRPHCYACNLNREFLRTPYLPPIPAGYSDVFLFHPRPEDPWMNQLEQAPYPLKVISQGFDNWLWKVEPKQP